MMAKLPSEIAADPVQLQRMRYAWEHYAKDAMPGYRRGRRVMNSIELPKHPIHELNGFGFEHIYLQSSLMTDTTRHDTSGDKTWMPNLLSRSTTRKHMPNGVPQYSPAAYAAGGGACKPGIKVFNSSQSKGHIQVRSAIIPADYCVRATQHVQSLGLVPSEKDIAAAAAYSPTSTLDSGSTSSPPSIHGHGYASNSSTSTLTAEWITWHPTVDKKDLAAAKSPSNSPSATAPREQQQQQQQLSMQQLQQMYGQSPRDLMGRSSRRSSYQRSRPNSAYSLDSQFRVLIVHNRATLPRHE
ncbi:hypothetical protein BDF19DRAFT_198522 [Syncephalis fuscata]|nr:hypothetical protein BDF19DRAFT_198522 [Syncephalis fuscata]